MHWLRQLPGLLLNRNLVLALAIALGLVIGPPAGALKPLTLPALGVLILMAASEVSVHAFRRWRRVARATGLAVLASFVVNTAAFLILARLLVPEPELYTGYVLVAASPPAASALAFCIALRGDVPLSLVGTVGAYAASLVLTPLIALIFAGRGLVPVEQLFTTLLQLIAVPLALSRVLRLRRVYPYIRRWREPIISYAYGLVVFTVVGVNRNVFFGQPGLVGLVTVVAIGGTFGLGLLVDFVLHRLRVERRTRISLLLLATLKNSGFAAAVALALVSMRASLPGTVVSAINALYLIWLGVRLGRQQGEGGNHG